MINKILSYIIFISFFTMIAGIIGTFIQNEFLSKTTNIGTMVFVVASIILLLINGDFINTWEFKLSFLGILIVIIGASFKIMHWPNAEIIMAVGYSSLLLLYIIYIFHFQKSHWIYAVKLFFLIAFLASKYLTIIHFQLANEVEITSLSLLIFLVCLYFIQNRKLSKKIKSN